jgi:hypothetical protein
LENLRVLGRLIIKWKEYNGKCGLASSDRTGESGVMF